MLSLYVAARAAVLNAHGPRARGDAGQATAEYALVLLGAAAIALLLAAWAVQSGKVTDLFDAVLDKIASQL